VAVIPGDGIGVDVTAEVLKVLDAARLAHGLDLDWTPFDYGAERYLATGVTLPDERVAEFAEEYDAVFVGALGDPRVPDMVHARDILLGLRFKLDLYINFRPVRLLDARLWPLKDKGPEDVCFDVFRENTEGLYVGVGGIFKQGTPDEIAIQEDVNTRNGVERIIRAAYEHAAAAGHERICMSDKSNALRFGHDLWQRTFAEVGAEYPDIEPVHLYVDALVMQLVKAPELFSTIVTCNMFGDIVTDLGAQLQGGLGLAASANVHPGRTSLFEPVHGSAPKYAGCDVANPMGALLSAALMLEFLDEPEAAATLERSVGHALATGRATRDLGGDLGTVGVGDVVAELVRGGA